MVKVPGGVSEAVCRSSSLASLFFIPTEYYITLCMLSLQVGLHLDRQLLLCKQMADQIFESTYDPMPTTFNFVCNVWKKKDFKTITWVSLETKLRQVNVFSGIPVWPLQMMHWILLYRDPSAPHPTPPKHQIWDPLQPQPSCLWHLVTDAADLFKIVHLSTPFLHKYFFE